MVTSNASTSTFTSTLVITLLIGPRTSTGFSAIVPTKSNNNDLLVGLGSAGAFALLVAVIGLLVCLQWTRTKHRQRIEDMERRLVGLESQARPSPRARPMKRFSSATGTSLGSSWGAWRSKDDKNFQEIRTSNQTKKGAKRKSFEHGWWSFSSAQPSRDPKQPQNATSLQNITSPRVVNMPQTVELSETDMEPLMAPRLSAIVECPSPARPDSPTMTIPLHSFKVMRPYKDGLSDDKEVHVTSSSIRSPSPNHRTSAIDKEVNTSQGAELKKVCNSFCMDFLHCHLADEAK